MEIHYISLAVTSKKCNTAGFCIALRSTAIVAATDYSDKIVFAESLFI